MSRTTSVDAGYACIRVGVPVIADRRGAGAGQSGNLIGRCSNSINILSAQVNYAF